VVGGRSQVRGLVTSLLYTPTGLPQAISALAFQIKSGGCPTQSGNFSDAIEDFPLHPRIIQRLTLVLLLHWVEVEAEAGSFTRLDFDELDGLVAIA